jgi:hypothetical protein
MNFKESIVVNTPREYTVGIVIYKDDIFYAKVKDTLYEISFNIIKYTTVYSKPNNNKYPEWTEKKNKLISNPTAGIYWSPFKPNMKIQGYIVDNKFIEKKSKK